MKLKNSLVLLFITFLIACTFSCNNDLPIKVTNNFPSEEEIPFGIDKETVYLYQTNKDMILYSLIRYDEKSKNYILDVTEKEIERLGISVTAYNDAKKQIKLMNKIDLECQ